MARRSVGKLLLAHLGTAYVVNFVKSCRQSLNFKSYEQRGAVIREKSVLAAYCVSSLVDTRSVLTGDLQGKKRASIHKGHCDSC